MNLQLTRMYGILIAGLAAIGLFVNGHLFQLMNTDIALDLLRVVLAAYLLYVGFARRVEDGMINTTLLVVGLLYVGMGVAGLASSTLGGLLPSGLTGFDIVFHLATGALAVVAGLGHGKHVTAH